MKESRSALSIFVPPINTGHIWMAMSGASLVMRHAGNGVVQATFYVVLTQAMKNGKETNPARQTAMQDFCMKHEYKIE